MKQEHDRNKITTIIKKSIINPSYRVVIYKDYINEVWLFDNSEKDLATAYFNKFVSSGKEAKLFERVWQEV